MQFVTVFDATAADLDPGAASPILVVAAGVLAIIAVVILVLGFRRVSFSGLPILLAGPWLVAAAFLLWAHDSLAVRHACSQTAKRLVAEGSFASVEGDVTDVVPIKRSRSGGKGTSFRLGNQRYSYCGEIEMDRSLATRAGKVGDRDHVRLTYMPETRHIILLELAVDGWSPRAIP